MLIKLFYWIRGYLLIRMKGQSPERFINLCSNRYIYLWDLKHVEGEYEFRIMLKDYLKLKPIAKKTGTLPYIKRKYGIPFLLHKYKKRKGYLTGVLLFCVILYILSLFIWDISVLGGHSYTQEAMLKFLKSNQIYIGLQKKNIDCQEIEELIRGTYNDIGWVSAEIKGTRLIIKITETNMPAPAVTATKNCHIVASKDCIITHIVTRTGTPKVEVGSIVKKGDILVSGVVDIIGDNDILLDRKPVIADADVIGKTYYNYKDKISLNYIQKQYTGKSKKSYNVSILLKKINLYKPRIPYAKYDIIVNEFMLHLSDNFYLPVSYSITSYPEYEDIKKKYTKEEVTDLAKERLKRFLNNLTEKDVLIVENNVKIAIEKNTCTAAGKIVVQESVKDFKSIDDSEWRIIDTDESDGNDN
ncbi:MAG: sporulation protein YqfD [Anaerocolumna sp.]